MVSGHMVCSHCLDVFVFFFFFQAEDGIRDLTVTGVQTCALPIYCPVPEHPTTMVIFDRGFNQRIARETAPRSEEHTSELQSQSNLVCRLLLEKKNKNSQPYTPPASPTPRGSDRYRFTVP